MSGTTTTSRSGSEENKNEEENSTTTETTAEENAAAETSQTEETASKEEESSTEEASSTQEEENAEEEGEDENKTLSAEAARKLRSENRSLRGRMRTAEDRVKELEPLAEELATLKRGALLGNVQKEYGLNDVQAGFLKGDTEEDLKTSAKALAEAFGIKSGSRQTVETPMVGSENTDTSNYVGEKFSIKRANASKN